MSISLFDQVRHSFPGDMPEGDLEVRSPIDGSWIGSVPIDDIIHFQGKIQKAKIAFEKWRTVPAPKRGEAIRVFGNILRENKENLADIVCIECGKIISEARGEVQEMIDICDFAVGLSRQLYGLTIASERPDHVMQENWLPIGTVGVISAFNFPAAVWAWNFALAVVCGNPVIWKPSEKTPLTAFACHNLWVKAAEETESPVSLNQLLIGGSSAGTSLARDTSIKLVSATGSCAMGKLVSREVSYRLGKCLLELGGNNAAIVTPSADLGVAIPSIVFGAVGTAGQRCTTTRRAFVHESIYDKVCNKLIPIYESLVERVGCPLHGDTLIGPLIDEASYRSMKHAMSNATNCRTVNGRLLPMSLGEDATGGFYVAPALIMRKDQDDMVKQETFAPILYVMPYSNLEEAMRMHNDVPQGLSSCIFTTDIREAEYFKRESDCGIANVNIGTSGAEIGGAFGGEKETGGGRESGSDAWKNYMRRQTSTTYYGAETPELAQGVEFNL